MHIGELRRIENNIDIHDNESVNNQAEEFTNEIDQIMDCCKYEVRIIIRHDRNRVDGSTRNANVSKLFIYIKKSIIHWRRKRGGGGGGQWYAPPLLTPHFYFPLELYVCITLTNNYLALFIYQLIILWTISIN